MSFVVLTSEYLAERKSILGRVRSDCQLIHLQGFYELTKILLLPITLGIPIKTI